MYQQLPFDITLIDTGLVAANVAACYLLESDGKYAIIETGNFETTERILALLEQRNISTDQVLYVIPTHVHLDHAGGASSLMQVLSQAQLVIHPRGARHMIDPAKLIAGATQVYGEATYKALYGDIQPIAEHRIIVAEDNSSLMVGNRKLLFRDTPGHANHHFCIWDETSSGWFTGDTFGIGYPSLKGEKGRLVFPSTTPIQFEPKSLINSIELMMSYKPNTMYLTHFGAVAVDQKVSDFLCQQVNEYVNIVNSQPEDKATAEYLIPLLKDYTLQCLTSLGGVANTEQIEQLIAMDIKLNSHGLAIWHTNSIS